VQPVGGHAIFLDAKRIYPHIPQDQFPAQTLAAELVPRLRHPLHGTGRGQRRPRPETGDHRYPALELVRLTIPRRVYTQAHMDVTAEAVKACTMSTASKPRAEDGLRTQIPALLPGAIRAD
jgi:tyrosine phenol-lyase